MKNRILERGQNFLQNDTLIGQILASDQNGIFGGDLIWRMINFIKFDEDLIWRTGNYLKFGGNLFWRIAIYQNFGEDLIWQMANTKNLAVLI